MSESMETVEDDSVARVRESWPLAKRIGFRFCFCYMMLYVFFNGNVTPVSVIDGASLMTGLIGKPLFYPFAKLSVWVGKRFFHLSGLAATWHPGSSGDSALYWILILVLFVIALLCTIVWSLLDRERLHYYKLHAWLRFSIRIMLGVAMVFYGLPKVFPFQMLPITPGQLNEPLGQLAPMTMLWSFIGMSPLYEIICGLVELAAGILIFVRRTALLGAILVLFTMSNVLLYNLFFDVPVKIFSAHLVLLAVFLIVPDVAPMWRFFVLQQPAVMTGVWLPQTARKALQRSVSLFEVCFALLCLCVFTNYWHSRWVTYRASLAPLPIFGVWTIRQSGPQLVVSPEGKPWTGIYIDNTYRAYVRDSTGRLWRSGLTYSPKGTLDISGPVQIVSFACKEIDPNHFSLTTTRITPRVSLYGDENDSGQAVNVPVMQAPLNVLLLERQSVPSSYPLLTRGFHFVNEWAYER